MQKKNISFVILTMLCLVFLSSAVSAFTWNTTFEEDLSIVWNFEESSGDLIDVFSGTTNGINGGADYGATGINNNAWDFELSDNDNVTVANTPALNPNAVAINLWINPESLPGNGNIFGKGGQGNPKGVQITLQADGDLHCKFDDNTGAAKLATASASIVAGVWTMVTCVSNDVTDVTTVYINGVQIQNSTGGGQIDFDNTDDVLIANVLAGNQPYDGLLDELYIYSDPKDPAFFAQLYDSGAGTFFVSKSSPTITLISPSDLLHVNLEVNFTANFTADGSDLVNTTLNIYNDTGLFSQSIFTFPSETNLSLVAGISVNLSQDGDYTWFYTVNAEDGGTTTSENRTVNFDSTVPLINFFNPPGGVTTIVTIAPFMINATVFDLFLDAVNVSVSNLGSFFYTNLSENLTVTTFNVLDTVTMLAGFNTIDVSARDTAASSPPIRDLTNTDRTFPNSEDEFFDYSFDDLIIRRTTYVVNNGGQKVNRQGWNLNITDLWDEAGKHIKTDIAFDKLQNANWQVRIDYTCIKGCRQMLFLNDRGRDRIIDGSRTLMWQYDDAVAEGWEVTYAQQGNQVSVQIGYPDQTFYNNQPARSIVDPIFGGLNNNTQTATVIYDVLPPVVAVQTPSDNSEIAFVDDLEFVCGITDDIGVAEVQLFVDDSLIATQLNSTNFQNVTLTHSASFAEGDHEYYCFATDVAGRTTNSTVFDFEVKNQISSICEDTDQTWRDASALTGLILVISLIGLVLGGLVLSFTGIIDLGNISDKFTIENAPQMIIVVGLTFLVIATMSFLIASNVCIAYGA